MSNMIPIKWLIEPCAPPTEPDDGPRSPSKSKLAKVPKRKPAKRNRSTGTTTSLQNSVGNPLGMATFWKNTFQRLVSEFSMTLCLKCQVVFKNVVSSSLLCSPVSRLQLHGNRKRKQKRPPLLNWMKSLILSLVNRLLSSLIAFITSLQTKTSVFLRFSNFPEFLNWNYGKSRVSFLLCYRARNAKMLTIFCLTLQFSFRKYNFGCIF